MIERAGVPGSGPTRPQAGIAVVEVVVAAVLLGLAFTGVSSMLATGRDMGITENIRRQGERLVMNVMEEPQFSVSNYGALIEQVLSREDSLRTEAGAKIEADVYIDIGPEDEILFQDPDDLLNPRTVHYKRIQAKAKWDFAGRSDSVVICKRIADVP